MIRRATTGDIDAIIKLGVGLISSGAYAYTAISYRACIDRLTKAMRSPDEWIGVALHEGHVVGFLIMVIVSHWWSSQDKYALDDGVFCTRPGLGRKLITAGTDWAFQHGATEVMIAFTSNFKTLRSATALKRIGFTDRGVVVSMHRGDKRASKWAA